MGYETVLLRRWSRRDRLAVLLIAITVAFLVGTTLVLGATGDATTTIAAEFDSVGSVDAYDSPDDAERAAPQDAVVVPVAELEDGPVTAVAGVGAVEDRPGWTGDLPLSDPPADGVAVADPVAEQASFTGTDGALTTPLSERSGTLFPPAWGVADRSTVEVLGSTEALVLSPAQAGTIDSSDTPLRAALGYFQGGSEQVLGAVTVVGTGVALLVAVVIFGVVRMTARDRRRTVFVVRATGGTRRRVLSTFAFRAGLLSAVGVALGYAVGVVATNLAVNAAVVAGVPTSLSVSVTPTAAVVLGVGGVAIVLLGALAGGFAAWPVASRLADAGGRRGARAPTAASGPQSSPGPLRRVRRLASPELLSVRTLAPMVASLATFAAIALLVVAGASAAGPIAGEGATVVEPGAVHPIASTVPVAYADAIEDSGSPASPEILAFAVVDGEPAMVRGASFDRFAPVSDANIVSGRPPDASDEAIVGADLARTLDLERGDAVTVGGSTRPAVVRVQVVGTYEAPGPYDDALLVPVETARQMTGVPDDSVQFVRTGGEVADESAASEPIVVDASLPSEVARGESVTAMATVANPGSSVANRTVSLWVDDEAVTERAVAVEPLSTERVRFETSFDAIGERTVRIGTSERTVRVVHPDTPRVRSLPETVPTGSEPLVRVVNVAGDPIPNATVAVEGATEGTDDRSTTTAADGTVRVAFDEPGPRTVVVRAGNRSVERTVTVEDEATRSVTGTLTVSPPTTGVLTRPTARARLSNPWNVSRTGRVAIRAEGRDRPVVNRTVTLAPGERTSISERLERRGPGRYAVALAVDGDVVSATNVTVERDDRLTSALASTDAAVQGSGLGAGVATALGNLTVLAGTLLALAAALAGGSVAFGLASAVDGRRRTLGIHRATGAGPSDVARLVVGDALRLAVVATPLAIVGALGALLALDRLDLLVFFGVRLDPVPSLQALLVLAVGALVVVLASAFLVGLVVVRTQPAGLLAGDTAPTPVNDGDGENRGGSERA